MTNFMKELLAEVEEKEQMRKLEFDKLKADQALMAVSKLESQIAEATKLCDDEIALIEAYRLSEVERLEKKKSWLAFNLEGFARQQLEQSGEKTLRLPHGSLSLRKGRDKIEIAEMDLFLKVAPRYGLVRTISEKHEPDLQALSAYVKRTGEIPVGTRLIPGTVNFSYTTNTKGEPTNGTE